MGEYAFLSSSSHYRSNRTKAALIRYSWFLAASLLIFSFVIAAWIRSRVEKHVVAVYQFDWVVTATKLHLSENDGDWPDSWESISKHLDDDCPWSIEEISSNVTVDFQRVSTVFVSSNAVSAQHVAKQNLELLAHARSVEAGTPGQGASAIGGQFHTEQEML